MDYVSAAEAQFGLHVVSGDSVLDQQISFDCELCNDLHACDTNKSSIYFLTNKIHGGY